MLWSNLQHAKPEVSVHFWWYVLTRIVETLCLLYRLIYLWLLY